MASRYSQHDDRCEPEERGKRFNNDGEDRYERREARSQGRSKIGDRLTYPSERKPEASARGDHPSIEAPPEPPRFNKYSGHDDRIERDDYMDGGSKKNGGGRSGERSWERSGPGRGEQGDGIGRDADRGSFRGGRGGSRAPWGNDSRGRRDGHDDRDEYDYNGGKDAREAPRGGGGGGGGGGSWEERAEPGRGRLSRSLESRLGEQRGAGGVRGDRKEGAGGWRHRNDHDDRDAGGGGGKGSGGGFGEYGGGARSRYRGEHDDRVRDGFNGGGRFGNGGAGGGGGRGRYRGEHDDRDAAADDENFGVGRGRGRGWGGRGQDDPDGYGYSRNGRGGGRGGGRRQHGEADGGGGGNARRGRDRERSRSPMGRWGHDKFQELLQEEKETDEGINKDSIQQDGAEGAGGHQDQQHAKRKDRWVTWKAFDRNGGGGGGGEVAAEGGMGGDGGEGDGAVAAGELGLGSNGKLDDELMAEAAEAAEADAYDELAH